MHCKDCKFYKFYREEDIWDDSNFTKTGKTIKLGECTNKKIRYTDQMENDDELIYDSENYSAALYVGELFGCVHFKEKENINRKRVRRCTYFDRDSIIRLASELEHRRQIRVTTWNNGQT